MQKRIMAKKPVFEILDNVRVTGKNENSVTVEFSVPGTNPYFDGHFPGFPILPAIAQTELIIRFASHFLGTGIDVSEISRIKFSSMIRPCTPLVARIDKVDKLISFKIYSPDNETVYSKGILKMRESESAAGIE